MHVIILDSSNTFVLDDIFMRVLLNYLINSQYIDRSNWLHSVIVSDSRYNPCPVLIPHFSKVWPAPKNVRPIIVLHSKSMSKSNKI